MRLALLGIAVAFSSCGDDVGGGHPTSTGRRSNVLVVTLDTTRADRLGCYGGPDVSPNLDELARRGVRLTRAHAPVPLTLPSHATLLTGLHPAVHGVRSNTVYRLPEQVPTLAATLAAAGYRTGAFVSAFVLDSEFGLDRGFETYDDDLGRPDGTIVEERPAAEVTEAALRWLREDDGRPFFAWVHYYDPHQPYTAPEPYRSRFVDPYLAEIAYADDQFGRLLGLLAAAGTLDDTLVVVTADHGEGLGDHGEGTHGYFLYQSTMHVPLVFAHPDLPAGTVVSTATGLADVAPTILAFLGLEFPGGLADDRSGINLLPELQGEPGSPRLVFMESELPRLVYGFAPVAAVTDGRHKLIEGGHVEQYELSEDPDELHDRAADQTADPETTEALRDRLHAYRALESIAAAHDPDQEVLQKLNALGYTVGRNTNVTRTAWTRDELLRVILLRDQSRDLTLGGNPEAGLVAARELIALAPECAQAQAIAGAALGRLGRTEDAIPYLQRSLELDYHQPEAHWNLATCYGQQGRIDEALTEAGTTLELNPRHLPARRRLAEHALSRKDLTTARRHLEALAEYGEGTLHGEWAAAQLRALGG